MVLSNTTAALVGFTCETALWGAYAILFGTSMVLLLGRRKGGLESINVPIVTVSCILFAACTTHFGLGFNHLTTLEAVGIEGYANETNPLIGADLLVSVCDLLGDFILIYRCWILWGRNYWVTVLPTLCAIAGLVCVSQSIHFIISLTPESPMPPAAIVPLTTAGFALPLCTNVLTTGFIIFKIWRTAHLSGGDASLASTHRIARGAIMIIVESGALYLITQLILVVLISLGHPAEAIVAEAAVQVYGIAPTLIVIRVGLGIAVETTHVPPSKPISWARQTEVISDDLSRSGTYYNGQSTSKLDKDSIELKGYHGAV